MLELSPHEYAERLHPRYPKESLEIKPSTGTYGRWYIKVSDVRFEFFWKKSKAEEWLTLYRAGCVL